MNTLISPETYLAPEEYILQGKTDGNYQSGTRWRVQFGSSDWEAFATIKAWAEAKTPVQAVAAAESKDAANLQWYESVEVKILRTPKARRADGDSFFVCEMIYEGDENAAIFNNVNLLHQANVNGVTVTGFVDNDASGLADGWVKFAGVSAFAAGEQSLTATSSAYFIYRSLAFPISGIDLTISAERTQLHGNALDQLGYVIQDFTPSDLSIISIDITTIGRKSVKNTTKTTANAFYFVPRLCRGTSPTAVGTSIEKEPALRTDGESSYIAG